MLRRDVVRIVGSVLALPFLPRSAEAATRLAEDLHRQLEGESAGAGFRTFTPAQQALVTELAEMIIPETDTPGATTMRVAEFIDLIVTDWANEDERTTLLEGLADIDARSVPLGAHRFVELRRPQKEQLLALLDEARHDKTGAGHAFGRIKALTVYGYFTSERVRRDVLKTKMFFPRYVGNAPFAEGGD